MVFKNIFYVILTIFLILSGSVVVRADVDTSIIDAENNTQTPSTEKDFSLQTFSSCSAMEDVIFEYLKSSLKYGNGGYYGGPMPMMEMIDVMEDGDMAMEESVSSNKAMAPTAGVGGGGDRSDFSDTNIQVAGVDEAEIVKTDGNYIYYYHQLDPDDYQSFVVSIADIRTDDIKIVKQIQLPDNYNGVQLILDDDKLVIIANRYSNDRYYTQPFIGIQTQEKVAVIVYDTSDPVDISLERFYLVDGSTSQIRRIGDKLYLLSQNSIFVNPWAVYSQIRDADMDDIKARFEAEFNLDTITPKAIDIVATSDPDEYTQLSSGKQYPFSLDKGAVADCDSIDYYLPDATTQEEFQTQPNFLILSVIDIDDAEQEVERKVLFGDASQIYMGLEHLYVIGSHYSPGGFSCPINARCIMPWFGGNRSSIVHKYSIDGSDVDYVNTAVLPGQPLTQYAMHDDGEYFYAVHQIYVPERSTSVFALDADMNLASKIENIAVGEDFRSSRFMGDKLYLVTFEQTDPLFTIDISDARNMEILGELKIPGYSTYLHPYDENHLIGIGFDTKENEWGGIVQNGIKVDLYDVSDLDNPTQKFTQTFGGQGSHSEVTYNPRMFVWNADKNLLMFPAQLMEQNADTYRYTSGWQGGLVLTVDKDLGIQKEAEITHINMSDIGEKRKEACERYDTTNKEPECYTHITSGEEICVTPEEEYRGRVPEYCFAEFDDSSYLAQNLWSFSHDFINRMLYVGNDIYSLSSGKISTHRITDNYERMDVANWDGE